MFVYYPICYVAQPLIQPVVLPPRKEQQPPSTKAYDKNVINSICHKIELIDSRISKLQQSLSPSRVQTDQPRTPKQSYFSQKYDIGNSRERIRISNLMQLLDQTDFTTPQQHPPSQPARNQQNSRHSNYSNNEVQFNKKINVTKRFIYEGSEALYEGGYDAQGRRSGMGSLFDASGRLIYSGMWRNDVFHGKGKLIFREGREKQPLSLAKFRNFEGVKGNKDSYSGNFVDGGIKGIGQMQFSDRNGNYMVYYGWFAEGTFDGKGCVLQESNQNSLEGEWKKGKYIA